jgi:hypothetical protein
MLLRTIVLGLVKKILLVKYYFSTFLISKLGRVSTDISSITTEIEPFIRTVEDSSFLLQLLKTLQFLRGNAPLQSEILKMLQELQKESQRIQVWIVITVFSYQLVAF